MRQIEVISVLIGALGTVTKHFEKLTEKLDLDLTIEVLRKSCLFGTVRIIRKGFGYEMKKKKNEEKKRSNNT